MPFYKFPTEWSEKDHGIVYDSTEFFERLGGPIQHLENELGKESFLMKHVVNQIKFIQLDRILNGCVN